MCRDWNEPGRSVLHSFVSFSRVLKVSGVYTGAAILSAISHGRYVDRHAGR